MCLVVSRPQIYDLFEVRDGRPIIFADGAHKAAVVPRRMKRSQADNRSVVLDHRLILLAVVKRMPAILMRPLRGTCRPSPTDLRIWPRSKSVARKLEKIRGRAAGSDERNLTLPAPSTLPGPMQKVKP